MDGESFGGANNNSTPQQYEQNRNASAPRRRDMDSNQRSRTVKNAKSSTPSRLGLDMISDWEVEEDRNSQGSPASARQPADPELAPNFVPVHPSHRGTFYKRKAKKKKKKKKRAIQEEIPKGVHGFYAQKKDQELPEEEEEYGEEWADPTGGFRNVRNQSPSQDSNSGRGSQMRKYEGFDKFQVQKTEQREAVEKAEKVRLGKKQKAKSAMILNVPGKIDEDEEYLSPKQQKSKKKDKSGLNIELKDMKGGAAYDELASDQQSQASKTSKTITAKKGKVKHNKPQKKPKKIKSGTTAAATTENEQEEESEEEYNDATSRADDATSQDELETKSIHERRKLGRKKFEKKGEESEKDDKKRKSMKNKFDYDALDKLAEYERQEKIANGELPPDEEILIHPDEDILFDQEDGHVAAALSYKKVKDNQWFYHCFDRQKSTRFNKINIDWYNTSISYIPCCKKSIKKSIWVTPTAVEIGLGPTLFLMTMKAFFWMFILFSILNIPLILLYCGQGVTEVKEGVEQGAKSSGLNDFFAKFSIGNLGTSAFDCANVNVGLNEKLLRFSCKHGKLQEFFEFGLQKIDNQSCSDTIGTFVGENDSWNDLQVDCNLDNGMTSRGKQQLYESFNDYCMGETYCDMPIKYSWFNQDCRNRLNFYAEGSKFDYYAKEVKEWNSWQYDQRRREPVIFGVAFCVAEDINIPFTPNPFPFRKHQFTYFILGIDFFTVFFMICFINLLETRYEEYSEIFDKRNVEMRDFTLEFTNLPFDFEFGGKELMLQAQVWNFMEKHVKEAIMFTAGDDPDLIEQYEEEKQWEVIDCNFITTDWQEIDMLTEMDTLERDKKTKINTLQKEQQAAQAKGGEGGEEAPPAQNDEASEAIIEVIQKFKKIKGEYIDIQEEKLYEKWTLSSEKKRDIRSQTFNVCFVTFKSMLGKDRAEQLFKFAKDDKRPEAAEKMFYERWLVCSNPINFSSYIGSHIRISKCSRVTRSIIIWILAGAIIAAALIGMVMFADYNYSLTAAASMNEACQPDIAVDIAFEDYLKPLKQRQGLLHCYCLEVYNTNGGNVQSAFPLFKKIDPELKKNPCEEWKFSYDFAFYLTIISGAMIGLLNTICVAIFENVPVLFEGCLTYQEQTKAQFNRIIIIQFLNIGVVLLFADFNLGSVSSAGIPILGGRYRDFDTDWYFGVGSKICFAMISNSIAPFFGELFQPIIKGLLRYASRNFKWHLLKKTNVLIEREKQRLKDEEAQIGAGGNEGEEGDDGGKKGKKGDEEEEVEEEDEEGEGGSRSGKLDQSIEYAPETYRSGSPLKKSRKANQGYEGGETSFQADGGDDEAEDDSAGIEESGEIEPDGAEEGETPEDDGEEEFGEDEPECEGAFGISVALGHLFQDDLNDFYVNPEIKTFYWYSWFFTNLLIYLMYGGSMPLMYPLGIMFFILNFYVEKFLFCRFHRKTFEFDESLPMYALSLMKWAIFIHMLMNCFMFTDKRLMTPNNYSTEDHYRPKLEAPNLFFMRRYDDLHSQAVILVFLGVSLVYLFYRTCIQPCCNLCKKCGERKRALNLQDKSIAASGRDKDAVAALIAEDFSDDIVKEMNIRFLKSLYIRSHKEYELFRTMVNAISYDQEKLNDDDANQFKRRLKQRVRHVEDTIDVHLNLIGGLEKYMDRTYIYKLAVLEENEEKIPMKDKKSQRLTDLIQSYNIMDCVDFAKPKLIQNRIDREMLELEYMQKAEQPVYC